MTDKRYQVRNETKNLHIGFVKGLDREDALYGIATDQDQCGSWEEMVRKHGWQGDEISVVEVE